MIDRTSLIGHRRLLRVVALGFAGALMAMPVARLRAQAVPAATAWPSENTNPSDQPLAGQQLGTSLTLNQGVGAINAENQSFDRFGLGLEAFGGAQTNFFGTQTNQETVGHGEFSADLGLQLRTPRTHYLAFYHPQYNLYPEYPDVNNYAQSFYQTLTHAISERAGIEWDLTAARFLSLNQFLPQALNIGGIGIVVPPNGTQLLDSSYQSTNAATTLRYAYLLSSRSTFTAALTTSFFLMVPNGQSASTGTYTERFLTNGADLRFAYQVSPRNALGIAVTPIYIYALTPSGHETAETVQATWKRQWTSNLSVSAGAGPLFIQSSNSQFGSSQDISYAVNAGLSRQVRQSQMDLTYSRAFVVNLLSPAVASNSVGFSTYYPMGKRWILSGAASYSHQSAAKQFGAVTVYGGSGQVARQFGAGMQIFARYSLASQGYDNGPGVSNYSYVRNQFGGGIRFNLGNSSNTGGMQ